MPTLMKQSGDANPLLAEADAPVRRKTRAKGEKSRQAILTAAMVVIAKRGLHAVTHRAIAAEAGVPLSLTTYFFSSLQDLIEQTFDHFVVMAASDNAELLRRMNAYIADIPDDEIGKPEVRRRIKVDICGALSRFIIGTAERHYVGVAVELNYLQLSRLDGELSRKVAAYRANLVSLIARMVRRFDAEQPEVDASLILGIVHRLEFECINRPEAMLRERIEAEVARMVGYILKV
jgi:AcrR family transcriptional regulator